MPHFHLPCCLLHPHRSQRQRAHELCAQDTGEALKCVSAVIVLCEIGCRAMYLLNRVNNHYCVLHVHSQAACFAALGISFMVMSLSFIIIDWTTGGGHAAGGH